MALTVSAALLLLVVVILLVRHGGLRPWHALTCALLGFYLASSSVAPTIRRITGSVAGMLAGLHL